MKRRLSFAALTALGLALVRPVAAQLPHYTISDLGVIPATLYPVTLTDVTRTGYALQNYAIPYASGGVIFYYNADAIISHNGTVVTTLELGLASYDPPHNGGGRAKSINDIGTVIAHTTSQDPRFQDYIISSPYQGYPYGSGSSYYGGIASASATALNNYNQAAVTTTSDPTSSYTTLSVDIWPDNQGGQGHISAALPADAEAEANAISEAGLVAGASGSNFFGPYVYPPTPAVKHAFVWTPTNPNGLTGTSRALTPLNAGDNSEAFAVNDLGEAAGTSGAASVYWNRAGSPTQLSAVARAINDRSEILYVGNLLGRPGSAAQDPTALVTNLSGWSSLSVLKLYNDGALVGTGKYNGGLHIFLLTPTPVRLSGTITLEGAFNPAQPVTFTLRPANGAAPTTVTQTLGANGSYAFDVAPDNYTILMHANKYLQVAAPLNIAGSQSASLSVLLPAGDANGDNSVDTTDFGILVGAYGGSAKVSGSGYDPSADFNGDGLVDTTDFGLLVGNYGSVGDL